VKFIDPTGLQGKMCDANNVCIIFTENGWIAKNANGDTITTSEEIEKLLDKTGKSDEEIIEHQARAAYLMLLVTHPEIEGDPTQKGVLNEVLSGLDENTTWFDFTVTIDGKEQTIHIGIDTRSFGIQIDPITGRKRTVIATCSYDYLNDTGEIPTYEIRIHLYQDAFSSVTMLFHIMGHEGVHMLDYLAGRNPSERTAFAWNTAPYAIFLFPFDYEAPVPT